MSLSEETKVFLIFVTMGIVFSVIFDIFRAIRKINKKKYQNKKNIICMQDIIYFLIIGCVLLITIINFIETELRAYLILAILLGIIIYISLIGNALMNVFVKFFMISGKIVNFLILPILMYMKLFEKQIVILKKYVRNCCKKIKYMINLNHIKKKFKFLKTKEDKIDVKRSEQKI